MSFFIFLLLISTSQYDLPPALLLQKMSCTQNKGVHDPEVTILKKM